jgi:MoaA/NifB/PqqE/SkfB family radical SAM enzyme
MEENLLNLSIQITTKCSLRCKLCCTYTPYIKYPQHYSYENITNSLERFFLAFDRVGRFSMAGGEPLLHPQLPELVKFFSKYFDRMNMFEIITNGTIIPNEQLLNALRNSNKVDIMVDDYGPGLSIKVPQITHMLKSAGIRHRVRVYHGKDAHLGGWLDVSDVSYKRRPEGDTEKIYQKCQYVSGANKNIIYHIDDKIYMCCVNHKFLDFIPEISGEFVDLTNKSLTPSEIKTQVLNLRNRKYLSACKYCNGNMVDSKRYAPAEQL